MGIKPVKVETAPTIPDRGRCGVVVFIEASVYNEK